MSFNNTVFKMSVAEELEYVTGIAEDLKSQNKVLRAENRELIARAEKAEKDLNPVKESLSKLTAEKSKWMRKEARRANTH